MKDYLLPSDKYLNIIVKNNGYQITIKQIWMYKIQVFTYCCETGFSERSDRLYNLRVPIVKKIKFVLLIFKFVCKS